MPDRDVLMNVSDNRFFDQTQAIDWSPPFALGLGVPGYDILGRAS